MEIIEDNHGEMDCLMMQQMVHPRATKKTGETVKYAERLAEKEWSEEERTQQMEIESWQEQEGGEASRRIHSHTEGALNIKAA